MEENNVVPEAPVFNPATMATPDLATPAAPVFEPTLEAPEMPAMPEASAMPEMQPVESVVPESVTPNMEDFGAMDPITMPEKPAEPDPVEEELKAPLKAAAPVPGSIGSAVSVKDDGTVAAPQKSAKKMDKKTTYILLGVVAGVIIVALIAVLISQLM